MSGDLLPCPFCGGKARLSSWRAGEDAMEFAVECASCGARTEEIEGAYTERDDAAAAWNRRTPAAMPDDIAAAERRGAEAMRERAAQEVDCGCPWRDNVLAATTRVERWKACGRSECNALTACDIRALPLPGEEPTP